MKNLKSNNTMNKTMCPKCEMVEVESIFTLCDLCKNEQTENREKEMIAEVKKIMQGIYSVLGCSEKENARLAVQTLEFAKAEFEKSIGALILDGAFESENDSGACMLKLYIRDYQRQIDYIAKTYL